MEATTAAAVTKPTDKSAHHPQGSALDRELFCPRLQRLLLGAASELGQRGNLAQVVASIERGGGGGGGEDPNLSMLRRLGATDNRGIDNRVSHLRELDKRWAGLEKKRQATGLALYLGTPRCHPTLREHFGEGQGGLAGVVLYRWQLKQAKGRTRDEIGAGTKVTDELAEVWGQLRPLEREIAAVQDVLARPAALPTLGPRPEPPETDPELSKRQLAEALAPYRATLAAWRGKAREAQEAAVAWRDLAIDRLAALEAQVAPLRALQALLCAQLAELAATGNEADDELGLVKICRGGLEKSARADMLEKAEADVRGLHRAWYATATKDKQNPAHQAELKAFKETLWG